MTIEEILTRLDEAVIMLNKRQLKTGIAMVQNARHSLDELKPLIMTDEDIVTLENAERHLPTDDSWSKATNDHAEAMLTGKPCVCRKCFK